MLVYVSWWCPCWWCECCNENGMDDLYLTTM
jgi:hypothetical protein